MTRRVPGAELVPRHYSSKCGAGGTSLSGRRGSRRVGCHDLRHSLAANALALGLAPTEVARLLRHANPAITLAV